MSKHFLLLQGTFYGATVFSTMFDAARKMTLQLRRPYVDIKHAVHMRNLLRSRDRYS